MAPAQNAAFEEEPDHCQAMIDWLSDKSPDVWHAVALDLNWDNALPVLRWITEQPTCDKGTAITLLWLSGPDYYVATVDDRPAALADPGSGLGLFLGILARLRSGGFPRAELLVDWERIGALPEAYRAAIAARPDGTDPYGIPPEAFTHTGRPPAVAPGLRAENNTELWDLLDALGTQVGQRPEARAATIDRVRRSLATTVTTVDQTLFPRNFKTQEELSAYLWGGEGAAKAHRRNVFMAGLKTFGSGLPKMLAITGGLFLAVILLGGAIGFGARCFFKGLCSL